MSYFSDRDVKRWKLFFLVSLGINVLLVAGLIAVSGKCGNDGSAEKVTANKKVVNSLSAQPQNSVAAGVKTAVPAQAPLPSDLNVVSVEIADNFFQSFTASADIEKLALSSGNSRLGELLSAHIARAIIWDIDLRKDMRKGDKCSFIFRVVPESERTSRADLPDEIEILAVNYVSQKLGKNIDMHFFKPENKKFGKFYYADGRMIEKLLKNSPVSVEDYIQITSHINDRSPKHEGVDFKAPVGAAVFAPFDGTVMKTDWKVRYNGNSIQMKIEGRPEVATFLHLNKTLVKEGQRVKAGEKIAESGNTGRSTAPHLHYQINLGEKGKVIDPFKYHETYYETLSAKAQSDLMKKISENRALMKL